MMLCILYQYEKSLSFLFAFLLSSCVHYRNINQLYSIQKGKKKKKNLPTIGTAYACIDTVCGSFYSSHETISYRLALSALHC